MSAVVSSHPYLAELAARRQLRAEMERAVARLLAVLDDLDGDPDAEQQGEDGDVLDQGELDTADAEHTAPERHGQGFVHCSPDDIEEVSEDEGANPMEDGDDSDKEPSLGSLHHIEQGHWSGGDPGGMDLEFADEDGNGLGDRTVEETLAC